MNEGRKYQRFVFEFEVEITDPLQARAANLNAGEMSTADGLQSMMELDPVDEARVALHKLLFDAIAQNEAQVGVNLMVESLSPRMRVADGNYSPYVLPAMRGRTDS